MKNSHIIDASDDRTIAGKAAGNRILHIFVEDSDSHMSIEQYMRSHGFSHRLTARMKRDAGAIICNEKPVKASWQLHAGDHLQLMIPVENRTHDRPDAPGSAKPSLTLWDTPLSILYEDEDILVINKDAGVSAHPSMGNHETTLANAVAFHLNDPALVYHCITRLDRNTSGVVLIAKHALSSGLLSEQMKRKGMEKHYLAIVEGILENDGRIEAPIARVPGSTIERCIDENGDYALTYFHPVQQFPHLSDHGLTLVEVTPQTGRTHQIRVHMRHIGHPIIGDFLYHPDYRYIARHALHAKSLRFIHPLTGAVMDLHAPLPADMQFILNK